MKIAISLSDVLFSIDGAEHIQLATAFFFAVALFIHQTKEVKQ